MIGRATWRELKNAIERSLIVCNEEEIQPAHLPAVLSRRPSVPKSIKSAQGLIDAIEELERSMIANTSEKCGWTKTEAAKDLGITIRVLSYKMENLGIRKPTLTE